jgi:putative lipoic acid-binding regulatory protein
VDATEVVAQVSAAPESPLKFPTNVAVKIFGRNDERFRSAAMAIARLHYGDSHTVSEQTSKKGNYLSLTITVRAETRAQIDAMYTDLVASDDIIMVI